MNKIIFFSIKNKLIIFIFVLALIGWGSYALSQLPIDAVPDITNNQVQIITKSPSFSAQEIEQFITAPLEMSLANLQQTEEIRSISRFGLSVITIVFEDDLDIYKARQLVSEKIKDVPIPKEMGTPEMMPISTGLGEIYQYMIRAKKGAEKKYSAMELRTIQDWVVRRQLAGTKGVAEVNSFGGFVKQYEISVNPEKLRSFDLNILDVFNALNLNNQNTGGSYIEKNSQAFFIRGEGMVNNLEDIQKIVVKNTKNSQTPILIRDIAEVDFGHAQRYGAMSYNGQGEVVGGIVMMLKGENSSKVTQNVKERIDQIQKTLPPDLVIEPFLNRMDLVNRAISTVITNLSEGGLIVIFVLILFLGNLRAGLVVASVIPLSLLFALGMMHMFGVSANLMSLGAIDFGLVVDGAVIILEAVLHRLHLPQFKDETIEESVYTSSIQIRQSAAFGELIILMVYLPILALSGIEGKMFKPMAQTVSFAIIGALILSLTYVPMMSAWVLKRPKKHQKTFADRLMQVMEKIYFPIFYRAMQFPKTILVLALSLFVFSLVIFNFLGGEFIPQLDEGDFAVETRLSPGTSLTQTLETSQKAENILLQFPEVKAVVSKIGTSEIPTDPMPMEANDLMVVLKDKSEWKTTHNKKELAEKMKEKLSVLIGVNFEFQQPIQMRFNELMTGVKSDIALKIYGENLDVLFQKANECAKIIKKIDGVGSIKVEQVVGLPQMLVKYNRNKIAQYGLNIVEINQIIQTSFAGLSASSGVYEGEKRFDLVVRFSKDFRKDLMNLKNIYVPLQNGNQIPLTEIAHIDYTKAPMQIARDDAKRRITIGINAQGRDIESLVNEIKNKIETKIKLPTGYYFKYGGQFENLEKAKNRLSIAVPVALLLIFVLLYFTFQSWVQSILIFTAIPLSAIGGVLALWLRGMPFSISAGVGFIALFGVAVLNGIVLIGYFNQLEKEGITDIFERIKMGVGVRLRPVLMTAVVAGLGFLPMALSHGAGAEVQKPLATVVIGGLFTSTALTLIVLPILYRWVKK